MTHTFLQVLSGIRLIKYYAWEAFYAHQVGSLREQEVRTVRRLAYVEYVTLIIELVTDGSARTC